MAAGSTYTPIATQTLSSTVATVTFSSIPATYTDLVLVSSITTTGTAAILVQFNGDTSYIYSQTLIEGNGSVVASSRSTGENQFSIAYSSANTTPYVSIANFNNYANTTTYKTGLSRSSAASASVLAYIGLWRSTAAINSILLSCSASASFTSGSTFTLYGIASA
jgi:hypothetical protein